MEGNGRFNAAEIIYISAKITNCMTLSLQIEVIITYEYFETPVAYYILGFTLSHW